MITKIEAKEACDWLQAAGFPQYVQLFKDCRFPVDVEWAKRDHHFLDEDALDSLCRRLSTLNKSVEMRLEPRRSKRRGDDCDEEDFCAISPNWTYDRRTRRWRRLDSALDVLRLSESPTRPQDASLCDRHDVCSIHSSSSTESEGHNGHRKSRRDAGAAVATASSLSTTASTTDDQETSRSSSRCSSTNKVTSPDPSFSGATSPGGSGRGSSSVSLEADGCFPDKPPRKKGTSLLRKMEKLRLRGTSGLLQSGNGGSRARRVVSGPVQVREEERMERLHGPSRLQGRPNSRASSSPSSPHTISSSSSNSHSESSSTVSTPSPVTRVRSNCKRSNSGVGVFVGTTPNNQNHTEVEDYRNQINNNNNSSHESLLFQVPNGHKPGTFPTSLAHKHAALSPIIDNTSVNWRTGSFHGYRGRHSCRRGVSSLPTGDQDPLASPPRDGGVRSPLAVLDHRLSVYDNVPDDQQLSEGEGGRAGSGSDAELMGEEPEVGRLLEGEDVFSALDSVLERIGNLQQLVSTWSENLSEDDCQRGSSSSSSTSSSSSSSSQDSPGHISSATSPCPSSPSHIHLDTQHPEETEEEEDEEEAKSHEEVPVNGEEPKTSSPQPRSSRVSQQLHWSSEQSLPSLPTSPGVENQSVSQFLLLQKLSLLKLTALMDKYSPSSKQGWNWTVPKTPKTKVMEVKGRRVFGVPLLLSVQQTGEPLPPSILRALVYLRTECLDQVGLFRKSGVKSRIQYLRELVESDPDGVSYDGQSAFDVADMVKQYFRDLPEPIFTSRLCESFLHIYQYFPKDHQLAAAQAAILLLPDENRMALRALLFFLRDVVACVEENQMTPTNIAVCLAPSLFHLNTLKRDANAPR